MAMGITLADNRLDLLGDRLYVDDRGIAVGELAWGPRIGIRVGTESPWRAWVRGHPAVSAQKWSAKALAERSADASRRTLG
jgi:DNA-3-methyladenine glycosylase